MARFPLRKTRIPWAAARRHSLTRHCASMPARWASNSAASRRTQSVDFGNHGRDRQQGRQNEAGRHRPGPYESAECHRYCTGTAGWQPVQGVRQRPRAWHLENAISTARALIDGNGTDRQGHAKRRRITRRRIISLRAPANSRNRTRPLTHQKRVLPSRVNKFFHSSV